MTKLIFLSGSLRTGSVNEKLAKHAAQIAKDLGADAHYIDLRDYRLPLYDGNEENGLPENAKKLKSLFTESDGFFWASPEYNSAYSPLLKNTIDWMSRPHLENESPLSAFTGKVAAISAASPGGLGGLRGLVPLRMLLSNINVHVIPEQVAIGGAFQKFDANDHLTDEAALKMLANQITSFVRTAQLLKA
jgi:NAD(P)H-dependent FMN reductase